MLRITQTTVDKFNAKAEKLGLSIEKSLAANRLNFNQAAKALGGFGNKWHGIAVGRLEALEIQYNRLESLGHPVPKIIEEEIIAAVHLMRATSDSTELISFYRRQEVSYLGYHGLHIQDLDS